MIRFFKRWRRGTVAGAKAGKFILYSIGEIVFIVIGILFALQIGECNESRKNAALELQVLQGIDRDLEFNVVNLEELIEMDSFLIMGNEYLLEVIRDPDSTYDPELDELFGNINRYSVFYPQRMAYESLKNRGFELISNLELRSEIINLYDYAYMTNSTVEMELKRGLYETSNVVFLRHLDTGEEVYLKKPLNFALLKKDQEFINHLAHVTGEQKALVYFSKEHLANTLAVQEKLAEEIGKLTLE